jgi:tetrapyrrole methylase family protein/MazG family protein
MSQITIVGLGPGPYDLLTLRAARAIERAPLVLLRTAVHPTVADFPPSVRWSSFDELYERAATLEEVYAAIADAVVRRAAGGEPVVYAVPGDPAFGEESVRRIVSRAAERGVPVELVPGVPFLGPVLHRLPGLAPANVQLYDALTLPEPNPTVPALVYQVDSQPVASDLKLALLRVYPPEHPALIVRAAAVPGQESVREVTVATLDRRGSFDHLTSVYLPAAAPEAAPGSFFGIRQIVHRLRAPGGCPWDRAQTHESLVPYLIEEAYEAVEAIRDQDFAALRGELGDVLLQVLLHSELADEAGHFEINDVLAALGAKLVRRHPHVFGAGQARTAAEVERNWEQLKAAEQEPEEQSLLDGVPKSLPALLAAQEIQQRVKRVGFDWATRAGLLAKLAEEVRELEAAPSRAAVAEELGDVLWMLAKLALEHEVSAEEALRATNAKFARRFRRLEAEARAEGVELASLPRAELLARWERAKAADQAAHPTPREPTRPA